MSSPSAQHEALHCSVRTVLEYNIVDISTRLASQIGAANGMRQRRGHDWSALSTKQLSYKQAQSSGSPRHEQ